MEKYQTLSQSPLIMSIPTDLIDTSRMDTDYYRPHFIKVVESIRHSNLSLLPLDELRNDQYMITDGIRKHTKTKSGIVLIRTQNFEETSLNLDDCVYIDAEQHQAAQKSAVCVEDLLIAIRGYLGKAVIVGPDVPPANINQHIARVSVDTEKANTRYLWAFFTSEIGRMLLERQVTGTVQQGITLSTLRQLQVPLPSRPIQDHIGSQVQLAARLLQTANDLIAQAKSDVEALIEGQLDTNAILSGQLKPPTWEDVMHDVEAKL